MISIIIPTLNEQENLERLIDMLQNARLVEEIIVVDGGSDDNTLSIAKSKGARVLQSPRGRAKQMNKGAEIAKGPILYFLHADCLPPLDFDQRIVSAVREGHQGGCFRLQFDCKNWFLGLCAYMTRFNILYFRFGDQSLFVKKNLFEEMNGFKEELQILEDQDIVYRLLKKGRFIVINQNIITSSRKYLKHGVFRTQFCYFIVFLHYKMGGAPIKNVQLLNFFFKANSRQRISPLKFF